VKFPFNLYLLAGLSAATVTLVSLPWWRRWCLRAGLVDDPGHRKIHDQPIPLAGGLAVLTGLVVPLLLVAGAVAMGLFATLFASPTPSATGVLEPVATSLVNYGFSRRAGQLAALLFGALGMLGLGWLDDRHELRPGTKFAGQLMIAALVAAAGLRITLFVEYAWFSYAVTLLWILTVTNAANFMDNMDGLCAGLGFIGAWCFAWTGAIQGQFLVASIGFLTCGALLGFLPFNFPRASVFLGDSGSHLVGYLLAVLAILPHFYSRQHPHALAVLKPLLILAILLGDLAWVVVLRWRRGQPFYVGDTNHLSHRLVRRGLSRTRAVLWIWLAAAALGAAAFW
jgi:UDP-GlcNAc:undecaprenyl-phosphate GlcNAc-1-phosphate transferase